MKNQNLLLIVCLLIFALVLIAAATGVFYRTPDAPIEYTTVRGERAVYQGSGLYRYDPTSLAREGVVWDAFNLLIGLPLFAVAVYLSQRSSLRGRLLLGGLLFYWFYAYLQMMVTYSFNVMFLVYVATYALSSVAFFINLHGIDVARLPAQVSQRFPRRLFIGYTFVVSAMLVFLWLGRILPAMSSGRFPPELAGQNTLTVQGFDLGMVVPLMLASGILLWRRSPWGYLLASLSISYGMLMSVLLPAWIAVPLIQEGKTNLVEAVPFLGISLVGLIFAVLFFRNVQEESSER